MIQSIFELDEFKPFKGVWDARVKELARRRAYYDGSVYGDLRDRLRWMYPRLYRGIKPLYLPLSRAVDVDAGIIPGGWKLPDDAPRDWEPAIRQVLDWSGWSTDGVLYVHYGAQYGLSGLKLADLRDDRRVVIKPVDPSRFMLVYGSPYDADPAMSIYCEHRTEAGAICEHAEIITPDEVRTYRDGQLVGVAGRDGSYRNELGFVPYVEVRHIETGDPLGEATYQKAIPMLDEVNQLASYLADIIAKHVEPQWAIFGAEPGEMTKSGDNIWFIPAGGDARPLVAPIDIDGVLAFVKEMADNVHGSLPELAFDELRSKDQIATATVELQLMELTLKVKRCRPNYDHGLARALRLAGRAAAAMGISELGTLDDDAFGFDAERPVLPLDPKTMLELEVLTSQAEAAKLTAKKAAEHEVFAYHIEQGVVSRNDARAALGLPPEDDTLEVRYRNLRAALSLVKAATDAGIGLEDAARLVGLTGITPEPAPQQQQPPQENFNGPTHQG